MTRGILVSRITIVVVAMPLFACASMKSSRTDTDYAFRGPGSYFASMEDAVIDALTYAYAEAQRTGTLDRVRGGVIKRDEHGFSYERIEVADTDRPWQVGYSLSSRDVARFHAYPISKRPAENQLNEKGPLLEDRRSVDLADPLHRPLFVLTPDLIVKAYYGRDRSIETLADLREYQREQLVADVAR